ncbi:chromate transporter [Anoxybacillus sp. J5B_2022]|uniref:chromate transporter n=1 Tax=Anoxybacillus sp. J5B_2022 TaxID=3003246 RepID=UPI0022869614|nr:chromate transporter [Anoxybacillus sp. J5B_2022]MCZ0756711.1 chromate transporter [Anoxybacillus sp. J5B_2022]
MDHEALNKENNRTSIRSLLEILMVSTKLGFTSFGGPIAHLGYFHDEYVRRRKWMDEKSYADLVALCQFLPGPASSQVGIGIGVMRAGVLGGIVSFLGFTLPSVIALIVFALILQELNIGEAGWIHGLKIVAVAVVAHAILGMAQKLTPDLKRKAIALLALVVTLLWPTAYTQVGIIILSALIGYLLYKEHKANDAARINFPISRSFALICLALFFGLLILLPILRKVTSLNWIAMFDSFYRSGSLVFGGGHVVLPLLEREFVPNGWISKEAFLAGYGAAQAVPGPLFTFAAYLGAVMNGWLGGLLATVAIFLPAFLLILGTLPFWDTLRRNPKVNGALMGVNAAVVGILISAFYQPIWISSILSPIDFAFVAILFSMLVYWKLPPWIIVLTGAIGGSLMALL